MGKQVNNLQQVIIKAAEDHPDLTIGFVDNNGDIKEESYLSLLKTAKTVLHEYQKRGIKQGDYLIILCNDNYSIINHFWAAILGGIIPTILQCPISFNKYNSALDKFFNVYKILNNPYVVIPDSVNDVKEIIDNSKIISDIIPKNKLFGKIISSDSNDIAYIQFSSGSTGKPKGILLSHKNIISNIHSISVTLKYTHKSVIANWMPLYHDMGLIGYHLSPMYHTHEQLHIETIDFIKNPFLWLQILSKKRVNITGCPNFGQLLINKHFLRKDPGDLDLSCVTGILNGAEPISADIMEKMIKNLSKYGFKKEAMMPVYGMAEATLAITFNKLGTTPIINTFNREYLTKNIAKIHNSNSNIKTQRIVSVGKPLLGIDICIRDKSGKDLNDGFIGEVCIKGENVFTGYLSEKNISQTDKDGWFSTGDQGFILMGNLYITGRYKDIIFINGMNFYSNDLEEYAIKKCELIYGKFIVGGYFDYKKGQDQIIIFLVGSDNLTTRNKLKSINKLYKNNLGIQINHFVIIKSNQIHKTSSGKIKRYKIIDDFLKGNLNEVFF